MVRHKISRIGRILVHKRHNSLNSRPNSMYTNTRSASKALWVKSAIEPSMETAKRCPGGVAQSSESDAAKVNTCFARSERGLSSSIAVTSCLCIRCASPAASNATFKLLLYTLNKQLCHQVLPTHGMSYQAGDSKLHMCTV